MKKIIFGVIFILIMQSVALAEKKPDYSLMAAPLEETAEYIGELSELEEQEQEALGIHVSAPDLSAGGAQTWEEEFYESLDSVCNPEDMVNQTLIAFNNGSYGIEAPIVVYFDLDSSMGTIDAQAKVRAAQLNEVALRYISDNPEYFYLSPRSYGWKKGEINGKLAVSFIQIIGKDLPEFDGTQEALNGLKEKYDTLISEINKIKNEIYFEGMTELDKLVLAHDYITENSAYYRIDVVDEEGKTISYDYGDGYSYNAYGILVNKKGVCQGLSYAYPCVLKALGYPIENIRQIRSTEMMHMWNFVKLGNKWYHVDLTWDDPLYQSSSGKYDMNDDSSQHEIHDYLLISNDTNTENRNEAGYASFSLEILGEDALQPSAADDTEYESGYFFNDPVDSNLNSVPGRVEHTDEGYRKYYMNSEVYFMNDTLKAPKYIISQAVNRNGVQVVYVLGSKQRSKPNEKITQYTVSYKNGRFLKTSTKSYNLTGFGILQLSDYAAPENGTTIKIITVASDFSPVANVPVMK